MHLREILAAKGGDLLTIAPTAMMADVVEKLCEHNCGCLIVCEGETMVGIISERDVLRAISNLDEPLEEIPVEARMTRNVITGSPQDDIKSVMGTMTKNHIRHLPVLADGKLAGMISIGDIVKAQHQALERENHLLMTYIQS